MAIQPSKLIIAMVMIAASALSGWLMDFSRTVATTPGTNGRETELNVFMVAPELLSSYVERYADTEQHSGVFSVMWGFADGRFHDVLRELFAFNLPGVVRSIEDCVWAARWVVRFHYGYCLLFCTINLCILSLGGGAICRIAALQFAQNEKPGIIQAIHFSRGKFRNFLATPLVPTGIVLLAGVFIFLIGLVSNIPFGLGELAVGILMPLALAAGAVAAIVLVGTLAGFNLMFPAIAYDGSDSTDAVSRSFNYVCVRPWRMLFYTAAAVIYGAVCYLFVRFFAFLLLWITYTGLRLGAVLDSANGLPNKIVAIWPEPKFERLTAYSAAAGCWSESIAAFLVYLCSLIVVGLVVSFIISFYFSANTVIYALMRNKVDNTPLDEIYTRSGESQPQAPPADAQPS